MLVSETRIRIARTDEYKRVLAVYAALGYRRTINPANTVWLAETLEDAVGIVRVAAEQGTVVLAAPAFLAERVAEYPRSGQEVILMRRTPANIGPRRSGVRERIET